MTPCEYCLIPFSPKKRKNVLQRFCSSRCSYDSRIKKIQKECMKCGNLTFNPKFCSSSCASSITGLGNSKNPKKFRQCANANCSISTKVGRKYCSSQCNPNRLKINEEEKIKRKKARQCEAWARYNAKRKEQTPTNENIKILQQFYENCPTGYEVDHIIPISKGGLHTLSNLQYLTISENRKKSNKIL